MNQKRKSQNLQAHSTRWGEPKVHVQLSVSKFVEVAPPNTPHGWVYGEDTDKSVDCKLCLRWLATPKRKKKP